MLVPHRLSIAGFRGYRAAVGFEFTRPVTVLFGANHCGKSSTLNALEWCLFGDDCAGKQTGIRERIGWVVANQHQPLPEAVVELELANSTGNHLVRRRWGKRGKRAAAGPELEVRLPDGTWLEHDAAALHLARLRRAEFRDFLTTVYQHQEAIRAVLTQEPKERNDAIDRLLGLTVYRNLFDALDRARSGDRHRALRQRCEDFERRLHTALQTRERDLQELRSAAEQQGITPAQQSWAGSLAAAHAVQQDIDAFAHAAGLAAVPLTLPAAWPELDAFATTARQAINTLRGALPCVREQQALFARRSALLRLQTQWETGRASVDALGRTARELDRDYRGVQAVLAELAAVDEALAAAQVKLRAANRRAALVREALAVLAAEPADACPLCRQASPDLHGTLRDEWAARLEASVRDVTAELARLQARKTDLEQAQGRYANLDRLLAQALAELDRLRQDVGTQLGAPVPADDDGLALLRQALRALDDQERTLRDAIAEKTTRLETIEHGLERVRRIRDLLAREEHGRLLEQIQQQPAWQELERLRDRAAEAVGDVEAIKAAVSGASQAEAVAKLSAAEATIDRYFRQLARHPGIQRLCLQVSEARQRNQYAITDAAGHDLTPILSQGDLNALALAIFLGLATVGSASPFGFVMLDDPSQSLGTAHKQALVEVLNEVARTKQVVVATMDGEFRELLRQGLTREQQEYVFDGWTVEHGPSLVPW